MRKAFTAQDQGLDVVGLTHGFRRFDFFQYGDKPILFRHQRLVAIRCRIVLLQKYQQEIETLISCDVDYIGFPFRLTHHQEDISETDAARLIRSLPTQIKGVLITYLDDEKEIINLCRNLGVKTVQLHGEIRLESLQRV